MYQVDKPKFDVLYFALLWATIMSATYYNFSVMSLEVAVDPFDNIP